MFELVLGRLGSDSDWLSRRSEIVVVVVDEPYGAGMQRFLIVLCAWKRWDLW